MFKYLKIYKDNFLSAKALALNALVFISHYSLTGAMILREDRLDILLILTIYCFFMLIIESFLILLLDAIHPFKYIGDFAISIIMFINSFSLSYVYSSFYLQLSGWEQMLFVVILVLSLYMTTLFILNCSRPFVASMLFSLLIIITGNGATSKFYDSNFAVDQDRIKDWGSIKLKSKPNIHLISFDSMVPVEISKKYLALDFLPYYETINELKGQIIPNTFVTDVPSWYSLNMVLKFDSIDGFPNIPNSAYLNGAYNSRKRPARHVSWL